MKVLVTGCAGFVGSHLTERLLSEGYEVVGIDGMTDNYERWIKERNLAGFRHHPRFCFVPAMLQQGCWDEWLDQVETVFHLAALPGVRSSWGSSFARYVENNVSVTQQLLNACQDRPRLRKIVIVSSSSVFGTMRQGNHSEAERFLPESPYGVTKAAMELVSRVYVQTYRLPVVLLRYFTVYGPRQRPDMAFHQFIRQMLEDQPLTIYGDGMQTRDFTYVSDAVEANLLAARYGEPGDAFNIGGDREVRLLDVIAEIGAIIGSKPRLQFLPKQPGDSLRTCADIASASRKLGYTPHVSLEQGLRQQVASVRELYGL